MSSYLNKQAPPPPPPKTVVPPPTSSSTLPASSEPPRTKPSHRHKQSIHYNDAPDLAALAESSGGGGGSSGVNRSRSSRVSRVPALPSLQSTPSTSGTTTPFNARASAEKEELALPAFNAPPLPPPLPQSTIRTGPRSLPYDILHYPPPSLTTKLIILFIPGNPGLIDYYRSFLSTLQSGLPSHIKESTELYAIGHLGHSLEAEKNGMVKGFKPNQQASLEEQVSSKCEFVDELFEKHGKEVKIMILGHSIGSWICLQVLTFPFPLHPFSFSRTNSLSLFCLDAPRTTFDLFSSLIIPNDLSHVSHSERSKTFTFVLLLDSATPLPLNLISLLPPHLHSFLNRLSNDRSTWTRFFSHNSTSFFPSNSNLGNNNGSKRIRISY